MRVSVCMVCVCVCIYVCMCMYVLVCVCVCVCPKTSFCAESIIHNSQRTLMNKFVNFFVLFTDQSFSINWSMGIPLTKTSPSAVLSCGGLQGSSPQMAVQAFTTPVMS